MHPEGDVVAGRYEIQRELGRGGMSVVYEAQDRGAGGRVALKTIRLQPGSTPGELEEARRALVNDAHTARELNHPGIVRIYDVVDLGESVCVVMELIEGASLAKFLERGDRPNRQNVLRLLRQVAQALDWAHTKGVVHRDVTPGNIMIWTTAGAGEYRVTITDFGIARKIAYGTGSGRVSGYTQVIGNPPYMSPEQAQGIPADGRSDQFSLAVVAYELLTGRKPFQGHETAAVVAKIILDDPERTPELGAAAEAVLRTALSKAPASRYRSCAAFVDALEQALFPPAPRERVEPAPPPPPPAPRRARPRWLIDAALAALLAGLVLLVTAGQPWLGELARRWSSPKVNDRDGLEYVWVSRGSFQMGCVPDDTECDYDERPRHQVTLTKGFWMGRTEVTVEAYQRYAAATAAILPDAPEYNPGWRDKSHPMVNVSWNEAVAYCEWAGGRLPAEAEWEYAARGRQEGLRYPWGNPITHENANYGADRGPRGLAQGRDRWENTAPVGSFPANGWNLFDMPGNVMEWTKDWYEDRYYEKTPSTDPRGPASGRARVFKGGSWEDPTRLLRSSWRYSGTQGVKRHDLGFRCVLEE